MIKDYKLVDAELGTEGKSKIIYLVEVDDNVNLDPEKFMQEFFFKKLDEIVMYGTYKAKPRTNEFVGYDDRFNLVVTREW